MKNLFALAAILVPTLASPCTRSIEPSPLEELERGYDQADAVFVANVLDVTSDTTRLRSAFRMTLQVQRVWKSDELSLTEVISGRGDGDCTIGPMTMGASYIVFASRGTDGTLDLALVEPVELPPFSESDGSPRMVTLYDERYKLALAVLERRSK
jgi:hypothetical protein